MTTEPLSLKVVNRRDSESQQQFLALFLRSEREVLRYIISLVPSISDAEEILQQTALALWEKFDTYDEAQPFTPWACRFALNMTRQWTERRQKWQALLQNGLAEQLASRREVLLSEFDLRLRHLAGCIAKLPDKQRTLIEQYYFKKEDVETLSTTFGWTMAATYKTLQRVRQSLQLCIENAMKQEELAS